MRPLHRRLAGALLAAGLIVGSPGAGATSGIRTPDGQHPAVVDRLGPLEGLVALALGPDGDRAVGAFSDGTGGRSTTLRIFLPGSAEPETIAVAGQVRALLFSSDGSRVYGLLHKPARKHAGETHLLILDLERLKARRAMRLPPTASGLAYWPAGKALLVACRNEVRTVSLPELRSGPLFPVPGTNLAIASVGGGGLALVGRSDGLQLVDLAHAPGIKDMPVVDEVASDIPVTSLAMAADGNTGLARLADGTLLELRLSPLRLDEVGTAIAIAAPRVRHAVDAPAAPSATVPPEPAPTAATPAPSPAVTAEPTAAKPHPVAERPDAAEPPAAVESASASEVQAPPPSTSPTAPSPAPVETEPVAESEGAPPPISAASVPEPAPPGTIRGRLLGPATAAVHEVVVLGPDNILTEAARVRPAVDGTWSARGLAPGRYRIQLDGGGGRVIVAEPRFRIVDLGESAMSGWVEFNVLRAL